MRRVLDPLLSKDILGTKLYISRREHTYNLYFLTVYKEALDSLSFLQIEIFHIETHHCQFHVYFLYKVFFFIKYGQLPEGG